MKVPSLNPLSTKLEVMLSWGMPPLIIPLLRWFQDPPDLRWKLFTRDFTTYSIGAGIFFGVRSLMKKALVGFMEHNGSRELTAFLCALGANLAFAGIGAIKLSKWIETQWQQLLLKEQAQPTGLSMHRAPLPSQPFPQASTPQSISPLLSPWPPINIITVLPR